MKKKNFFASLDSQTASELAIFGAIFVFVLGLIIRYALSFNYTQNQSLEAMRLAFQTSFTSAISPHAQTGDAQRAMTSILFVEDRKDVDVLGGGISDGKFASINRTPYIMSASGAFSPNLYAERKWNNDISLPVMDVYINGQHFVLTTAGFVGYDLCSDTGCTAPHADFARWHPDPWYTRCADDTRICSRFNDHCYKDKKNNWKGCVTLYTRIPNDPNNKCSANTPECNDSFDINRQNGFTCPTEPCVGARRDPTVFSWRWKKVLATTKNIDIGNAKNTSLDVDGDLKEEQILELKTNKSIWLEMNPSEKDLKLMNKYGEQAIAYVRTIDFQEGDIDLTLNTWDAKGKPTPVEPTRTAATAPKQQGLASDWRMYSFIKEPGTYLTIEEGKLYGDGHQYIRDAQKNDKVDVIERTVQLNQSHDITGHICPQVTAVAGVCCNTLSCCTNSTNIFKTCFDSYQPVGNKRNNVLYIRSSLSDRSGRKWITDVNTDKMPIASPLPH